MRILFICMGNLLTGFGNAVCLRTGLGADPLNVLYSGTAVFFKIPVGRASLVISLVMIGITLLLDYRQIWVGTVMASLLVSRGISFGMTNVPAYTEFPFNYVVMMLGLCIIALGISMSIYADFGKGSYDALIFGIQYRTKLPYYKIRWALDLLYLVVGVLLGGKITPATLIAVAVTGKMITYSVYTLKKTKLIKDERKEECYG